jgi:hypothetical protein
MAGGAEHRWGRHGFIGAPSAMRESQERTASIAKNGRCGPSVCRLDHDVNRNASRTTDGLKRRGLRPPHRMGDRHDSFLVVPTPGQVMVLEPRRSPRHRPR